MTLAGVRQHAEPAGAFGQVAASLERTGQGRAAGDAGEDALLRREPARELERRGPVHRDDPVDEALPDRILRELGNEIGSPALHRVRTERGVARGRRSVVGTRLRDAAAEHLGIVGLADDDAGLGPVFAQHAPDALQRAATAVTGDPGVEALATEILEDLVGSGERVHVGVGLVLELAREEPAVRLGELTALREHAAALERGGRQHDAGAEEAHQLAPLDTEVLGHHHHQRVALRGAHHREPDARVAAGRLHHRLPGREPAEARDRRVADRPQDARVPHRLALPPVRHRSGPA